MEIEIRHIEIPTPDAFAAPRTIRDHLAWLARESERHNLTRVPEEDWYVRHVQDSLVPEFAGWNMESRFLDLGTGAGFPGVPLAVVFREARFTLLEKKKKTARILNEFLSESGLSDRGAAVAERAEILARNLEHRGSYDRVVVRAVAALPVIVELGIPFLERGGELWCWKSDLSEVESAATALDELGAEASKAVRYRLTGEKNDRFVIVIAKVGKTPDKYPRRAAVPEKRPLLKSLCHTRP